jgi:hypothetical protein
MAQTSVEQENKTSWMIILAGLIVIFSLVAYYMLAGQTIWVRLAALLGGFAVAIVVAAMSSDGQARFIAYAKESVARSKESGVAYAPRVHPNDLSCIWFCSDHVPFLMACRQIN